METIAAIAAVYAKAHPLAKTEADVDRLKELEAKILAIEPDTLHDVAGLIEVALLETRSSWPGEPDDLGRLQLKAFDATTRFLTAANRMIGDLEFPIHRTLMSVAIANTLLVDVLDGAAEPVAGNSKVRRYLLQDEHVEMALFATGEALQRAHELTAHYFDRCADRALPAAA